MPYINKERRKIYDKCLDHIGSELTEPGELNYCITMLAHYYLKKNGGDYVKYRQYNDVIGVLTLVGTELMRRYIAPYEDLKIMQNGDLRKLHHIN